MVGGMGRRSILAGIEEKIFGEWARLVWSGRRENTCPFVRRSLRHQLMRIHATPLIIQQQQHQWRATTVLGTEVEVGINNREMMDFIAMQMQIITDSNKRKHPRHRHFSIPQTRSNGPLLSHKQHNNRILPILLNHNSRIFGTPRQQRQSLGVSQIVVCPMMRCWILHRQPASHSFNLDRHA